MIFQGSNNYQNYGLNVQYLFDNPDQLTGTGGRDTLQGYGSHDTIYGGDGDDILYGNAKPGREVSNDDTDHLYGDSGNDALFGGLGVDLLNGGADQDTLYGGAGNDGLVGDDGNDMSYGSAGNDSMYGNGNGTDYLYGGVDNDSYTVFDAGDIVVENANEGNDQVYATISYTLPEHVEHLGLMSGDLNGTGNSGDNEIVGTDGFNRLDGKGGADRLEGRGGNDTYVVDDPGDLVIETDLGGADTVLSSVSFTLGDFIEYLELTGTSSANASGNALNNWIYGNGGNNTINGHAGADWMDGHYGNDTYYVDAAGDRIIEVQSITGGTDRVFTTISYALAGWIENLYAQGSSSIDLTGNGLANTIYGNSGGNKINGGASNDSLAGGAGKDHLTGDTGRDTFLFNTKASSFNVDKILDYSVKDDTISLENAVFTTLRTGKLASSAFWKGAKAHDRDDRLIYDAAKGYLYYDADGTGSSKQVLVATMAKNLKMTYAEFSII